MIYERVVRNRQTKKLTIISMILFCSGFLFFLYGSVVIFTDYSLKIKFDNNDINFFENEELYFSSDISMNCIQKGYNIFVDGKRKNSNSFILREGIHTVKLQKHFNRYIIKVNIDYTPNVMFVDKDGEMIHNYLSNNKPFMIKVDNIDSLTLVDNVDYDGSLISDEGNYSVLVDGVNYNINILKYGKES